MEGLSSGRIPVLWNNLDVVVEQGRIFAFQVIRNQITFLRATALVLLHSTVFLEHIECAVGEVI